MRLNWLSFMLGLIVICASFSALTDGCRTLLLPPNHFNQARGPNDQITTIVRDPATGKFYVGGTFITLDSHSRNYIARVNADGTLDLSFDPGAGFDASVYALVLQSDGKLLVGGAFETFKGTQRKGIARLNNDGTL